MSKPRQINELCNKLVYLTNNARKVTTDFNQLSTITFPDKATEDKIRNNIIKRSKTIKNEMEQVISALNKNKHLLNQGQLQIVAKLIQSAIQA